MIHEHRKKRGSFFNCSICWTYLKTMVFLCHVASTHIAVIMEESMHGFKCQHVGPWRMERENTITLDLDFNGLARFTGQETWHWIKFDKFQTPLTTKEYEHHGMKKKMLIEWNKALLMYLDWLVRTTTTKNCLFARHFVGKHGHPGRSFATHDQHSPVVFEKWKHHDSWKSTSMVYPHQGSIWIMPSEKKDRWCFVGNLPAPATQLNLDPVVEILVDKVTLKCSSHSMLNQGHELQIIWILLILVPRVITYTPPKNSHTVDGRNPTPPGMYKTLCIMGYLPYQLVSRISSINSSTWKR